MTGLPFQPDRIYLGWQHVPAQQDPGPSPQRPVPPPLAHLSDGWVRAQQREERRISRPLKLAAAGCLVLLAAVLTLGQEGVLNAALTTLWSAVFAAAAGICLAQVWRGIRDLRTRIAAEERRVSAARAVQERALFAAQEEHARRFRAWQEHERAFARQPQWYPATLPGRIDRLDVAGGTLAGWAALLTTIAVPRLAVGGEVTVIDLSEGAVARDLASLADRLGLAPLVWVLPQDLPRFDLGAGLPATALAGVLAASTAADLAASGGHDPARDHAIIERVLSVLGDGAGIAQVTAALRALGQVGDPRDDVGRGLLTTAQLGRVTGLFGRGAADRVVIERAFALEARLRVLESLGSDPVPLPRSKLRVVAADRAAGAFAGEVLGTYVTVALTDLLSQARPGRPWRHTVCLAGADKLRPEVADRLMAVCEAAKTGLVLAYRSIPPAVKERLGRGNAALAVMRLGNAEDAKAASEQIGSQHRFVLSQFTDTVGASVTDSTGESYTRTVGSADSVSASVSAAVTAGHSRGRGHTHAGPAPFAARTGSGSREASRSVSTSDSRSITAGINDSTSWGLTTSRALGTTESLARTTQRSREFLVEPHELQQLPPSAVIVSYASREGRQVVLADANPAILTLPTVATQPPGEPGPPPSDTGPAPGGGQPAREPVSWRAREGRPPPNLGPPPEPLDWRRRRPPPR